MPHLMMAHTSSVPIAPDRPVVVSIRLQTAILQRVTEGRAVDDLASPAAIRAARARLVGLGLLVAA